jgi:hypothetical protein
MNTKCWLCVLIVSLSSAVRAETLDERKIGANATWVVHVDIDRLRACESFRLYAMPWLESESVHQRVQRVREMVGLDPTQDLHSVTFYGDELVRGAGAMIVRLSVGQIRLRQFLADQPDYAAEDRDGHELLSWSHRRKGGTQRVFAAFYGSETLVFSMDVGELLATLQVLEGEKPNLSQSESSLRGSWHDAAVLTIRARDLSKAKLPLKSPILRGSELVAVTVGEDEGTAFIETQLIVMSEQQVADFRDVAIGLISLARLRNSDNEQLLAQLENVELATSDRTLTARWSGKVTDVIELLGKARIRKHLSD